MLLQHSNVTARIMQGSLACGLALQPQGGIMVGVAQIVDPGAHAAGAHRWMSVQLSAIRCCSSHMPTATGMPVVHDVSMGKGP